MTIFAAASVLLANVLLKFIPEGIMGKAPQLNETEPIGAGSKLLSAYDSHGKGAVFKANTGAAVVT